MQRVPHIMAAPSSPRQPLLFEADAPPAQPAPGQSAQDWGGPTKSRQTHASGSVTPVPRRAASTAILTGEAGANLVLSRLQEWGVPAQMAMPGLAYDLIADVPGYDLLRIQVKTKSRADGRRCAFALQRGFHYSKNGTFRYHADDYDIAAFVCLRGQYLFFCAGALTRISVRTAWLRLPGIDRTSFDLALQQWQRRRQTDLLAWLATLDQAAAPLPAPATPAMPDAERCPRSHRPTLPGKTTEPALPATPAELPLFAGSPGSHVSGY